MVKGNDVRDEIAADIAARTDSYFTRTRKILERFGDTPVTYAIFLPIAFSLAWWTSLGPVALFAVAKLSDFGKAATACWWLAKERWVRNLADPGAGT